MDEDFHDPLDDEANASLRTVYVKRPDLRHDEVLADIDPVKSKEAFAAWQWWIDCSDLYAQEAEQNQETIWLADLPFMDILLDKSDPIKIIAYFCGCHERGVYPPAWVMNDLYERFSSYLSDNGKNRKTASLGKYFKEENRSGKFREATLAPALETACFDAEALHRWFGVYKGPARAIVAERLLFAQDQPSNPWRHERPIGTEALRIAHNKRAKSLDELFSFLAERGIPSDSDRLQLLERIGEEFLAEDPNLIQQLHLLRKAGTKI